MKAEHSWYLLEKKQLEVWNVMLCQTWVGHLLLFACMFVCDQQVGIIDERVSVFIYLGKKCYESIKWLAARLGCTSRHGSNWRLKLFVWDSLSDTHTLCATLTSIRHVWSKSVVIEKQIEGIRTESVKTPSDYWLSLSLLNMMCIE